jgi:hypothetical protein
MAYEIVVFGSLAIEPPLNRDEVEYLQAFSQSRRVLRERGPYAVEQTAGYEVPDSPTVMADVLDNGRPAEDQPGLWCPWTVSDDGRQLEWDEIVEHNSHADWLHYLIAHFLTGEALAQADVERAGEVERFGRFSFDHRLNGILEFEGEDAEAWAISVLDSQVTLHDRVYTYNPPLPG